MSLNALVNTAIRKHRVKLYKKPTVFRGPAALALKLLERFMPSKTTRLHGSNQKPDKRSLLKAVFRGEDPRRGATVGHPVNDKSKHATVTPPPTLCQPSRLASATNIRIHGGQFASTLLTRCDSATGRSGAGTPVDGKSSQTVDISEPTSAGPNMGETSRTRGEPTMTMHPLLLPPPNQPSVSAHRLSSLYFEATLGSRPIPEFSAEYITVDGQYSSILLTFKDPNHADYLKEAWDSIDRENTCAPGLADISLYRGNISAQHADISVREAAFDELASYRLITDQ